MLRSINDMNWEFNHSLIVHGVPKMGGHKPGGCSLGKNKFQ